MTLQASGQTLEYANIAATILVVWRLYDQGLYRVYHWFFVYLIYDLVETPVGLIPLRDPATVYRYMVLQAIKTALGALVVFEIYHVALDERKALARFSRNLIGYILGVAVLVSAFAARPSASSVAIRFLRLRYTLVLEGAIDSTLFLFLSIMAMFLLWFPLEVKKNIVVYIVGFEVSFAARWAIILLIVGRKAQAQVDLFNVISFAVTLLCLGFWAWGMRRSGEFARTTTGHRWNPEEMGRLKAQLDEINTSLERLARK